MEELPVEVKTWVPNFLDDPTRWSHIIVEGWWNEWTGSRGRRYCTSIIKELFVVAQEVLEEEDV